MMDKEEVFGLGHWNTLWRIGAYVWIFGWLIHYLLEMSMRTSRCVTGTTILAMMCSGGAVVAADSRLNMGSYILREDTEKIHKITNNIVCLCSGVVEIHAPMIQQLMTAVNQREFDVVTPAVLAERALDCFASQSGEDSSHATICGWDSLLGAIQIYHVDVRDNDLGPPVQSIAHGSGMERAKMALTRHSPTITMEAAKRRAIQGLCNASYFDMHTGGVMNVVYITKDGCAPIYKEDSLTMYRDNFSHEANEHVVFLLCPRETEVVDPYQLANEFGSYDVVIPPHCVAMKRHFSFHRLLLSTAEDVASVLRDVRDIGAMPKYGVEVGDIMEFRMGRKHGSTPIYVVPKTLENLELIRAMDDYEFPQWLFEIFILG